MSDKLLKKIIQNINILYPEDRLMASKKRLSNVWNKKLQVDRIPFVFNDFIEGIDSNVEGLMFVVNHLHQLKES